MLAIKKPFLFLLFRQLIRTVKKSRKYKIKNKIHSIPFKTES